jgi:hypothetical protein
MMVYRYNLMEHVGSVSTFAVGRCRLNQVDP